MYVTYACNDAGAVQIQNCLLQNDIMDIDLINSNLARVHLMHNGFAWEL